TELYNLRVNCNSSQKLPRFTSFTTLFETLLFMPLTSLLLGQDSMLMLFIYAGFHNRQLARTRLDCDLRTPSLVEYPTLLLATQTYQPIGGLDPALWLISEVSHTNRRGRVAASTSARTLESCAFPIVVRGEKLAVSKLLVFI